MNTQTDELSDVVAIPLTPDAIEKLQENDTSRFEFFTIKPSKLILLSLSTCFIYLLYWFYQNWYYYRTVSGEKFKLLNRAGAYPFSAYSLFMHVNRQCRASGHYEMINIKICWGLIVFGIAMPIFPFPISLFYFALPLIGVLNAQKIMMALNEANGFAPVTSNRYSAVSIFLLILTFPVFLLAVAGFAAM